MKRFLLLPILILSGCFHDSTTDYGIAISQKKQTKKVVALQKMLAAAENEQRSQEQHVSVLKEHLRQAELDLIRKSVETCEFRLAHQQKDEHVASLFLEEREQLHKMIHSGSTPASLEAQVVLDQILRIITNFSER